ncbi:MAG: CpsD/CapB family tyrosine-protein kinase, partial [Enterococcus sp.]
MAKNNKRKASKTNPVSLITLADRTSPISEQYRTIRTNIQFATTNEQKIQTIVVTSSGPGEGKSTSSANLAVVFANAGQKVLLVDADMRKPTVFKTFRLTNTFGLSTLLSTAKRLVEIRQETAVENLFVLTSGPKPPNPSEMLGSPRMDQIIAEAKAEFDIVIFDMPPIVAVT